MSYISYEFTKLFSLSKSMKKQNIDYQVIDNIPYKENLNISALFKYDYDKFNNKKYDDALDEKKYILGLFKRGTCEYLELPLIFRIDENNYEKFVVEIDLDSAINQKIRDFLEMGQYEDGKFNPKFFFIKLHKTIPTLASKANLDRLVCSYSYPSTNEDEQKKIFFYGFRDNNKYVQKRSLENYAKTEKLLPDANKLIGKRNISVRFTADRKDEDTEKMEYEQMIKEL